LQEYVAEFTSDKAAGEDGYLADKGLIPLPTVERLRFKEAGEQLAILEF